MKEIIFIGDRFYWDSKTMMSSMYEVTSSGYERYDWGLMSHYLMRGIKHFVRPATKEEIEYFNNNLIGLKKEFDNA
jgi:hypothetical protein